MFKDPVTGELISTRPAGQAMLWFFVDFEAVARHVERKVERLRMRRPSEIGKISKNRLVMHNAPAIVGTRIMTSAIWNFHEAGYDADAICREYPRITRDDVQAALSFEAQRRKA